MDTAPIQSEGLPTPFITSVSYEPQVQGWTTMGSGNIFGSISDLITGIGGIATQGLNTLAGVDLAYGRYDYIRETGLTPEQGLAAQNRQLLIYAGLGVAALVALVIVFRD